MVISDDIAGLVEDDARADAFTDQDFAVEHIAVIDFRRNADDSRADFLGSLDDGRIAGIGNGIRFRRFLELVHRPVIGTARRKKGIVDLETAEDADGDEDDGGCRRNDMFALHHNS